MTHLFTPQTSPEGDPVSAWALFIASALDSDMEIAALLAVIGTVLAALISAGGGLLLHVQKKQGEIIKQTQHQVKNDHGTNLRDDLDEMHNTIRQALETSLHSRDILAKQVMPAITLHHEQIGGLKEDMRHERRERLLVADRIERRDEANLLTQTVAELAARNQEEDEEARETKRSRRRLWRGNSEATH